MERILKKKKMNITKWIDLVGQRFGKLVGLERTGSSKHGFSLWLCRCDCGNEKIILANSLKTGNTVSCGCYKINKRKGFKPNLRHGNRSRKATTKTYKIWCAIKKRCLDKNHDNYKYYGGRGIKVCDRWLNSFESFIEDMGPCPVGMTIERIDNNGNYEPDNCKWATRKEQARNRTDNRWIEYNGKKMILADWAKEIGITSSCLSMRINGYGWSLGRALTEKLKEKSNG